MHDAFDWVNAAVGGIGLLLTVGALWQATGAKKAATEARESVYRRNAGDDIVRLSRLASALLSAIEKREESLALQIARDFIADCPKIREHHREWLGSDGGKLDVACDLVRMIARGIQAGTKQDNLIESGQRIVVDIGGLAGVLSRDLEVREIQ